MFEVLQERYFNANDTLTRVIVAGSSDKDLYLISRHVFVFPVLYLPHSLRLSAPVGQKK